MSATSLTPATIPSSGPTRLGLDAYLAGLPGRCAHGWHLATQGCGDCGDRAKAVGQAIASAAHPAERAAVDAAIVKLAATGRPFSANDARVLHGVKGGVVGAAFTAARKAGLIRQVGFEASTSAETHGHLVGQWVGVAA